MKTKRIQWLDFAKGLTILFVMIIHCTITNGDNSIQNGLCSIYAYYINTFIMPIFFAISGFLYKRTKSIHGYFILIYKKFISLLIPYFIFSFMYMIFHMNDISIFTDSWEQPYEYLWFLYALFFIFIIVGLLDLLKISPRFQLVIYVFCSFIQMCLPWWNGIGIHSIPSIFGYIIFFYLGFLIHYSNFGIHLLRMSIKRVLLYISILMVCIFIQMMYLTGMSFNPDRVLYTDIITKIGSVLVLFPLLSKASHNTLFYYFSKYGKYTLIIYLVHFPIRVVIGDKLLILFPLLQNNAVMGSISIIICTYILSLIICYLSKHLTILNFIFYPRKNYISKWLKKTTYGEKFLGNNS